MNQVKFWRVLRTYPEISRIPRRTDIQLLNADIDIIIEKIKDVTQDATKAAISKGVSDISAANNVNLEKMDTVFAENMSLIEDLNSSFIVKEVCKNTTEDYIACYSETAVSYETGMIANIKRETDIVISELCIHLKNDTTIANVRDNIISDIT